MKYCTQCRLPISVLPSKYDPPGDLVCKCLTTTYTDTTTKNPYKAILDDLESWLNTAPDTKYRGLLKVRNYLKVLKQTHLKE